MVTPIVSRRGAAVLAVASLSVFGMGAVSQASTPPVAATPASVAVAPAGRWALGDSVMLGSKVRLRAAGFRIDAVVSRQFSAAPRMIRAAARAGTLPRNVVIHLGTNGTIRPADCRAIVTAAGPGRRVFFVTVKVPRAWQNQNNTVLRNCVRASAPGRARLVDWYAISHARPTWFARDQFHPNGPGRPAYVALIDAAVDRYGRR